MPSTILESAREIAVTGSHLLPSEHGFGIKNANVFRNGRRSHATEVPLNEMMNSILNKQPYGIEGYTMPSNEMWHNRKILNGKSNKEKFLTFAESIIKKRSWVPGPA